MKKSIFILVILLTTPLLAQKYVLKDGSTKLVRFIENNIKQGKTESNPVIVINEAIVKGPYLEALSFSNEDIIGLFVVEKGKKHLTNIYGKQALNGVISVTTKVGKATAITFDQSDANILIYIDGILATQKAVAALTPDEILSMNVISGKKVIATYTDQFYTSIIQISTKEN